MDPVRSRTLSVTVPADIALAVQPHFAEALQEQSETLEGAVRREWSATDQRGVKPEILLPPSWAYLPTVCLSTGNWKTYGARGPGQTERGRLRPEGSAAAGEGADPGRRGRRGAADRHPQFRREADPLRRAGAGRTAAFGRHAGRPDAQGKLRQQRRPRRAAPRHAARRRLPAGVRPRLRRPGRRRPDAAARRRAEPVGLQRRARARAARRQGRVPERHRRVRRARRHRARRLLRARPGRREALHHPAPGPRWRTGPTWIST